MAPLACPYSIQTAEPCVLPYGHEGPHSARQPASQPAIHPKPVDLNRVQYLNDDTAAVVDDMFTYHPWTAEQIVTGHRVRTILADAVKQIIHDVPPCPDRSAAIRKLREARMDCNSAIAHGGRY